MFLQVTSFGRGTDGARSDQILNNVSSGVLQRELGTNRSSTGFAGFRRDDAIMRDKSETKTPTRFRLLFSPTNRTKMQLYNKLGQAAPQQATTHRRTLRCGRPLPHQQQRGRAAVLVRYKDDGQSHASSSEAAAETEMAASAGVAAVGGSEPQRMSDDKGRRSAALQRLKSQVDEMGSRFVRNCWWRLVLHLHGTSMYVHA